MKRLEKCIAQGHTPIFLKNPSFKDKKFPVVCKNCGTKGQMPIKSIINSAKNCYNETGKPPKELILPKKPRPFIVKSKVQVKSHPCKEGHKYNLIEIDSRTTGLPYGQYDVYISKCLRCGFVAELEECPAEWKKYIGKKDQHEFFVKNWEKNARMSLDSRHYTEKIIWNKPDY